MYTSKKNIKKTKGVFFLSQGLNSFIFHLIKTLHSNVFMCGLLILLFLFVGLFCVIRENFTHIEIQLMELPINSNLKIVQSLSFFFFFIFDMYFIALQNQLHDICIEICNVIT